MLYWLEHSIFLTWRCGYKENYQFIKVIVRHSTAYTAPYFSQFLRRGTVVQGFRRIPWFSRTVKASKKQSFKAPLPADI